MVVEVGSALASCVPQCLVSHLCGEAWGYGKIFFFCYGRILVIGSELRFYVQHRAQ